MDKKNKKRFVVSLSLLVFFIFILNTLAQKFYWYYSIWYFDMIMHFLGGLWLGLVFVWLFLVKKAVSQNISSLVDLKLITKILLGVLIIGVFWEIFEFIFNNILAGTSFDSLDTISDIFCDLTGGAFVIFYFLIKKAMLKKQDKV